MSAADIDEAAENIVSTYGKPTPAGKPMGIAQRYSQQQPAPTPKPMGTAQRYSQQQPVDVPPPSRSDIDAIRMRFLNTDNPNADALTQAASALAKNPKDKTWIARVRLMHPASQAAIREKIDEIHNAPIDSGIRDEEGHMILQTPQGEFAPPMQMHDAIRTIIHGPEGARQLQNKKGFAPEIERAATSLLDPDSLALMGLGGGIAATGKLAARAVTATFAGMAGKGAYDKLRAGDPGGAAADLFMGTAIVGGHALAEKKFFNPAAESEIPSKTPPEKQGPQGGLGGGTEPKPEPKPEPRPEPKPEPKSKPEPKPKSKPKPESDADFEKRLKEQQEKRQREWEQEEKKREEERQKSNDAYEKAKQKRQEEERKNKEETARKNKENRERRKRQYTEEKEKFTAGSQTWNRPPGEPFPPPPFSNKETWSNYRKAHAEWRNPKTGTQGSTAPPKNPYESYAQWEVRRKAADASKRAWEGRKNWYEWEKTTYTGSPVPDPPPAPMPPFVPKDPGTPHPEVDKFNAYADKSTSNMLTSDEVISTRGRILELSAKINSKQKTTLGEKAEFASLSNKYTRHENAVNSFRERYKAATGRDSDVKSANLFDRGRPPGKEEVLDSARQGLREGHSTFENMFPDAEAAPEAAPDTKSTGGGASPKTGGTGRNRPGMLDLSTRGAPGSPAEKFHAWMKEHPEDIGGAIRAAAESAAAAAGVSRETPKPARFSALAPSDTSESTRSPNKTVAAPPDSIESTPEVRKALPPAEGRTKTFKSPKGSHSGYITIDLPPPPGAGPVGRILHHGTLVSDAMNQYDAASVSGPSRAAHMTRDLYAGLDENQKTSLDDWMLGNQLNYNSKNASTQVIRDNAASNPGFLSDAELNLIAKDPKIKIALDKWEYGHRPVLDKISKSAGVFSLSQNPHYFPLVAEKHLDKGHMGLGKTFSSEKRNRPRATGRRKEAKNAEQNYSSDIGAVLNTVLRRDTPTAKLNDLWRTLDKGGFIVVKPRGKAGTGWSPPPGYTSVVVRGRFTSAPSDIQKIYGNREDVYMPADIIETMQEIGAAPKVGSRNMEIGRRVSRLLTSTLLSLNPIFPLGHIYRQTSMLQSATKLADAKRNPATILTNFVPGVRVLVKGVEVGFRNVDEPIYQHMIQEMIEDNVISPRAMIQITDGFKPLEKWNAMQHNLMFGMPHGQGVDGWAIRIALEAKITRQRVEGTRDPEADRKFISNFGHYTRRLSPWMGKLAEIAPFTRTHVPRLSTGLKHSLGISGMRTKAIPGESAASYVTRDAGNRLAFLALTAAPVIFSLMVLNKMLSGHDSGDNEEGHELGVETGGGGYIPIWRLLPEIAPAVELSGLASRMHRERTAPSGASPSSKLGGMNTRIREGRTSDSFGDTMKDLFIGAGNTAMGVLDSPATSDVMGLMNVKPYRQYNESRGEANFLQVYPQDADLSSRAWSEVGNITGMSSLIPPQWKGYDEDPLWNIAKGFSDYVTGGMVKTDHSSPKNRTKKFGRI